MRAESTHRELAFPNEDPERLRAFILRLRRLRPPERIPRHVGEFDEGDRPHGTVREICGRQFRLREWEENPRAKQLTWHLELLARFPEEFVDEPICSDCLEALPLAALRYKRDLAAVDDDDREERQRAAGPGALVPLADIRARAARPHPISDGSPS